jgi:hypothetical protein
MRERLGPDGAIAHRAREDLLCGLARVFAALFFGVRPVATA